MTAVLWGAILFRNGQDVSLDLFKPFLLVVAIDAVILSVFDRWLWRLPLLRPWLVTTPDIRGTWVRELRSSWTDGSGKPIGAITTYLVVHQTESRTRVLLMTADCTSESLATQFE